MKRLTGLLLGSAALTVLAGAAWADILIGTAGPMTGPYASFGEQMKRGAEMAVADINAKGGVLGQKLVLEIGDDACDPKQAVAVANQMVNKKIKFMAGHFCSGSSIPASKIYNEEGILQMTPASTNPKLTEQGYKNVFRTCGRDDVQGIYAANYVVDKKVGSKIAILHDKSAYGKGLADEFQKQLNKRGVKEVMYEAYNQGDKDFSALITKMKGAGVDLVYIGGYHTEAGLITRQSREQGFAATVMSGDALVDQQYWQITGSAGEGSLMTFGPDARKKPSAAAVLDKFKAKNIDPEGYTLYTYAAIQVFAEAATKAGTTDLDALIKVLRANTFNTVIGPLAFDEKGDIKNPEYVMYKWSNGQYSELKG
ncbi:MAG: branched-chain amino acid ABC transporter substrate-binding protein [Geminicoccaceae bacterium]|nr:branched-chain amino acid ABC transporter substrate-binding protein [Geminicoccaceae bacterium]